MDEHHFELMASNIRRMNKIWYKGFLTGVFWASFFWVGSVWLIGWLSGY